MIEAVIFDVDGVLVDSYRPHYASWRALAAEHGLTLTEPEFRESFGRTSRDIIRRTWGDGLEDARIRELDARKEALYREIVAERFPAMPGARELVEGLHRAGFRLGVGSSGPPENVALALDRLGCGGCFTARVTGDDVTRGKPDPEVFLLGARRLGVAPERCAVVEDAPDGVQAARAAGMPAVGLVSTGRDARELERAGAARVVDSLDALSPAGFRALA